MDENEKLVEGRLYRLSARPPKCPRCGGELERDEVDVGVGPMMPCGQWGCEACHWVEGDALPEVTT